MRFEDTIRRDLVTKLHILEEGLTLVDQNHHLRNPGGADGYIDILARDRYGKTVIIELKRSDAAAREALHEVLKYIRLFQSAHGLSPHQLRCFIVSTEWHELSTPFAEFQHICDAQAEGFRIRVTATGEVTAAERIPDLPSPEQPTVFRQHAVFLYMDELLRKESKAWIPTALQDSGCSGYLIVPIHYNGQNPAVIYPYGLYVVPTGVRHDVRQQIEAEVLREQPELEPGEIDFTASFEDSFLARVVQEHGRHFSGRDATFEIGYPEKATSMFASGWVPGTIHRAGPFASPVAVTDADVLRLVTGYEGANADRYERLTSPKLVLDWENAKSAADYCLRGNPTWQAGFTWFVGEIERENPDADVLLSVYNPLAFPESVYHLATAQDGRYVPQLRLLATSQDGTVSVGLVGTIEWDGITRPSPPCMDSDGRCEWLETFYFAYSLGGSWELDPDCLERHGFTYGLWHVLLKPGSSPEFRRISVTKGAVAEGAPTIEAHPPGLTEFISSNSDYTSALILAIDHHVGR